MPQLRSAAYAPQVDPRRRRLDWTVVLAIGLLHVGCFLAPFTFTWSGLILAAVALWLTSNLGITLCYHRLLTHRSFVVPKWLEYTLVVLGTLNWQGGPIRWVGTHRLHHAESDQPGDPHSPLHGFAWAHVFWTLLKDGPGYQPYEAAKDLQRDPVIVWLDKYFFIPQFTLAVGLYALGWWIGGHALALSWLIWVTCVRTVVSYHGTWFVNSASHIWGYRNFETTDESRNNWWVALLSFGEGWHNNHHAYQRSAAHGLRWWEFDLTYTIIRGLAAVGLARKVVLPEKEIPRAARKAWSLPTRQRAQVHRFEPQLSLVQRVLQLLAVRS